MPAVLCKMGFMDNAVDVSKIISEDYANKAAQGLINAIVERGNLKKKPIPQPPKPVVAPISNVTYCVQVGAYKGKANAEAMQKKLKAAGFDAIIK